MKNRLLSTCALLTILCVSCRSASWVTHNDPLGFRVEAPSGWQVTGGAFRFASVDIRKAVQASSPEGRIRITGGDAELPTFTEPNQMLAMTGFREGSWYSPGYGVNMMVRRYASGTQFAGEYVATRVAKGCANLKFTETRDRPDVDGPLNQLAFTCEQSGQPVSGYYFAGSLRTGAAGMPGVIVGTQTDSNPGWNFQQMVALP